MHIYANYSLKERNTFDIDVQGRYLVEIGKQSDIPALRSDVKLASLPWVIFGGGSNLLLTRDLEKVIVTCQYDKIRLMKEDKDHVWLSAGAGLNWHEFVRYTVEQGYWGLENLAHIPGTVGAAPVQNVGAYGAEARDTITRVQTLNLYTGERVEFRNAECEFGYRTSVFKQSYKNRLLVHRVTFRLRKAHAGQPNLVYDPLKDWLKSHYPKDHIFTSEDIFQSIIKLREQKIPDPRIQGNAGSFFKNPLITEDYYRQLTQAHGEVPYHKTVHNEYKIPAAWLIKKAGWQKGRRLNRAGVSEKHSLVLVNLGNAKGPDILALAHAIQEDVDHKFGIHLEREVIIIR
jgi:UDP-N-acetylmuramate dehydrogenase